MQRKRFLYLFAIFLFNVLGCKENKNATREENMVEKPNILIIYPDQLRRYSAGYWSEAPYNQHVVGRPDKVFTPNIDTLAKNGMVFTNAISNFPLCSPARGMFLTGRYPEANGIWNNCRSDRNESLRNDVPTLTDLFYESGYNTAYFGKCHWLKNDPLFNEEGTYIGKETPPGGHYINRYDTYVPPGQARHQIEYFYQSIRDTHYDPLVYSNDANAINGKKDGEQHQPQTFSVKDEAAKIVSYLGNKNRVRDPSKPFFIMWSINPPHNPWDDKNTDMEVYHEFYSEHKIPELETLVVRENADLHTANYARHYFANVTSVDNYIGKVIAELKKMEEFENTIIVLSSDHGEMLGSHGKEGKNTFETESLAIPLVLHWPRGFEGGQINETVLGSPDVLPTLMSLSGLSHKIPNETQGIDFFKENQMARDSVTHKKGAALIMLSQARGIYNGKFTLVVESEKKEQNQGLEQIYLYNNEVDHYQQVKIPAIDQPGVTTSLLGTLAKELKRTNDPWFQSRLYSSFIPYED